MLYKIYQITCLETGEVYYGKTSKELRVRIWGHNIKYSTCTSKRIIERGNYKVDILETCDESNSVEREGYYIRNFDCVNRCTPGRSKAEYHFDNKEHIKEWNETYQKKWYIENKIKKNNQANEWYIKNKTKRDKQIKAYAIANKEQTKYRQWWTRTYHLGILARNYFD